MNPFHALSCWDRAFLPLNHIPDVGISVCNDSLAQWRTGDRLLPSRNKTRPTARAAWAWQFVPTVAKQARVELRRRWWALVRHFTGHLPPSANVCKRRWVDAFLPGHAQVPHGSGRSEPKRQSWLRSGATKGRWELLQGEHQLTVVSHRC